MRSVEANVKQGQFHKDLTNLLKKHVGHLSAQETLALAAYAVGQIIALQDQRTMTRETALAVVSSNIEAGNKYIIDKLKETGLTQN